jgi:hypothetical protein
MNSWNEREEPLVKLAQSVQSIRTSPHTKLPKSFWKIAPLVASLVLLFEIINTLVVGTSSAVPDAIFGVLIFAVLYKLGGAYLHEFYTYLLSPSWRIMLILAGSWALDDVTPGQGSIQSWEGIQSILFSVISLALFAVASRPTKPAYIVAMWKALPTVFRWRGWRGIFVMLMVALTIHAISGQIEDALRGYYHADAISFVHMDADVLLQGRNPYTDNDAFWASAQRWPQAYATPIYGGAAFGKDPFQYPTAQWMADVLQLQATFDFTRDNSYDTQTVHNYPAGIILMALPFVWAGIPSLFLLNLILFVAMIALVVSRTPNPDRPAMLLALVLCPSYILYGLFVNIDIEALIFVLIAWYWFDRRRCSAVAMGFACAVKQLAWFFLPFYLLEVARRDGYKAAFWRLPWMALAFLVPNLPFIIASPQAWFHSMLIPMSDPMFPMGFGLISLALAGLIPFGSEHTWTLIVLAVSGILFIYQWKRKAVTSDGSLLAFIPLWFSWRSPLNYFTLAPFFVAWIAARYMQQQQAVLPKLTSPLSAVLMSDCYIRKDRQTASDITTIS